jgi:hypothetical protein
MVQAFTPFISASQSGDPLYIDTLEARPLYPIFAFFMLVFSGWSLVNLIRSAREAPARMPRKQFNILAGATLIAGLAGPISITSTAFHIPFPMVINSALLGLGIGMIGYGIAAYSALVEGRTRRRDLAYNAIGIATVTLFYLIIFGLLVQLYDLPRITYIFAAVLGVLSHSLYDLGRGVLDRLLFKEETRNFRANLRAINRLADDLNDTGTQMNLVMDSACSSVRAKFGLLLFFQEDEVVLAAKFAWEEQALTLDPKSLYSDDFKHLPPQFLPDPLEEAAFLLPLYFEATQVGAILLGQPENGVQYSEQDVEAILDYGDMILNLYSRTLDEQKYIFQIQELARQIRPVSVMPKHEIPVKIVENALRNLKDYAYLGDSPLSDLKITRRALNNGSITHIDRGKALYQILVSAVEKLKPDQDHPGNPPSREWYAYTILNDAYIAERLNRDIMAQLYISEGTFNRTRRAALRSVTRILMEMEEQV